MFKNITMVAITLSFLFGIFALVINDNYFKYTVYYVNDSGYNNICMYVKDWEHDKYISCEQFEALKISRHDSSYAPSGVYLQDGKLINIK